MTLVKKFSKEFARLRLIRLVKRTFAPIHLAENRCGRCGLGALRQLVEAGVNRFTLSLHGHEARLHDALTRTPGSFEQARAGLDNLVELKRRRRRLRLHTSTVLNRRNLPHLADLHAFLAARPVDLMVLNVVMAKGRAALHLDSLVPSYREVIAAVARLCASLPGRELARLRVEDVPPCVMRALPAAVRGPLELYQHFESMGSTGLAELPSLPSEAPLCGVGCPQVAVMLASYREARGLSEQLCGPAGLAPGRASLGVERGYYLTDRAIKEQFERVKGEPCSACVLEPACQGVYAHYAEARGFAELEPITRAELARDPTLRRLVSGWS